MENLLKVEYTLLSKFTPSGIYIVPHYEELINSAATVWDGIIFVRAGPYRNGKFWFFICFPEDYPKSWPRVQFHTTIYHPLINPQDGTLDIKFLQNMSKPEKPFTSIAMLIVTFIKQIFYCEEYWKVINSFNPKAGKTYLKSRTEFVKEAKNCVDEAEKRLYLIHQDSTLRFSEPKPEHDVLANKLHEIDRENVFFRIYNIGKR